MQTEKEFQLLVLCTGNICRSPVAEAMFQKLGMSTRLSVTSAGVAAPVGVCPEPVAVAKALELGYVVSPNKRSRQVSLIDLQRADLILVMELHHKQEVRARQAAAASKTFLLGHWNDGEISDPIGRDEDFFTSNVAEIEVSCVSWVEQMKKSGLIV